MRHLGAATILIAMTAACGGDEPQAEQAAQEPTAAPAPAAPEADEPMQVQITSPADGAQVTGPSVLITLDAIGLDIVPAGQDQPRSGHHHLIVNADLPAMDVPIPATPGEYIHMGAAQTELELTDLAPGDYRVIALVGDFAHVPLDPPVADTVTFTVQE